MFDKNPIYFPVSGDPKGIPGAIGVGPKKACGKPMKAPGIDKSNSLDWCFLFPKFLSWTFVWNMCTNTVDTVHIQLVSYEKGHKKSDFSSRIEMQNHLSLIGNAQRWPLQEVQQILQYRKRLREQNMSWNNRCRMFHPWETWLTSMPGTTRCLWARGHFCWERKEGCQLKIL